VIVGDEPAGAFALDPARALDWMIDHVNHFAKEGPIARYEFHQRQATAPRGWRGS